MSDDEITGDLDLLGDWLDAKGYGEEAGLCTRSMDLIHKQDAEITRLRAENKELLEALKPFVRRLEVLEETIMHRYAVRTDIDVIHLRAARAAIEGVTEKSGAVNE